jgi:hypothetical protein
VAWAAVAAAAILGAWAASAVRGRDQRLAVQAVRVSELESERVRLSERLEKTARALVELREETVHADAPSEMPALPEAPAGPPEVATARNDGPDIRYVEDRVSLRVTNVPVAQVLEEIGRQAGALIRGRVNGNQELSAEFEGVPLPEALHRILGTQNFVVIYDEQRHPRLVNLVSDGESEALVARPAASPDAAMRLLAGQAGVGLGPELAGALGAQTLPLRQLIDRGLGHEAKEIRSQAVRTALETIEADAELRAAVLGSLPALSNAALAELVRRLSHGHDEEALFYVATQTRAAELRNRAVTLLQQLQADAQTIHAGS